MQTRARTPIMDDFNFCVKLKLGPELLLFQIFDGKIKTINYGWKRKVKIMDIFVISQN